MLFEVINARYLKGSIITTSHVGISSWADHLGDPMLAAALVDRLLHRGIIVGIDGPSYRMRSHQARADALTAGTTTKGATSRTPKPAHAPSAAPASPGPPHAARRRFCSPRCRKTWWRTRHHQPGPGTSTSVRDVTDQNDVPRDAPNVTDGSAAGNSSSPTCPHCRQPVAAITLLVAPAAAHVTHPAPTHPRHANRNP